MSWLLGIYSRSNAGNTVSMPGTVLHSYASSKVQIFAGGNPHTCLFRVCEDGNAYFLCGYAIDPRRNADCSKPNMGLLSAIDLPEYLDVEDRISNLDGHYIAVKISKEKVLCYNDPLCKRTLYFHETKDDIIFSSDLAIIKSICKPEIDYTNLGAYWHGYFAPTFESYYMGIKALGTFGRAVIDENLKITGKHWTPKPGIDLESTLVNSCRTVISEEEKIAIGLSGGMDCRALYAVLLAFKANTTAISYGDKNSNDIMIASRITRELGKPFRHVSYEQTDSPDSWQECRDYIDHGGITLNPVNYRYTALYQQLSNEFRIYLSGYWGEFYRLRLQIFHLKSAFIPKVRDFTHLAGYLYRSGLPIFIPEVSRMLYKGFKQHLQAALEYMPGGVEYSNPKWFDLFYTRYAFHGFSLPKLHMIDRHVIDHMPYLQNSVISGHWNKSIWDGLREQLHRDLIKRHCPELRKFPLVLGEVTAPFCWNQFALKIKYLIYLKRHALRLSDHEDQFLASHKDNIMDLLLGKSVREYPAYDQKGLIGLVSKYYQGNRQFRTSVLKWLAFELGR